MLGAATAGQNHFEWLSIQHLCRGREPSTPPALQPRSRSMLLQGFDAGPLGTRGSGCQRPVLRAPRLPQSLWPFSCRAVAKGTKNQGGVAFPRAKKGRVVVACATGAANLPSPATRVEQLRMRYNRYLCPRCRCFIFQRHVSATAAAHLRLRHQLLHKKYGRSCVEGCTYSASTCVCCPGGSDASHGVLQHTPTYRRRYGF